MRWFLLAVLTVACGGKSTAAADASVTSDGGCQTTAGDVGNCFSNVRIDSPAACGFAFGPSVASGTHCDRVCGAGTKCCNYDGANTVRCEYCACP